MTVSILSNGRCFPAFGLAGGQPGQPGKNRVIRTTGEQEELAGCEETFVDTGDTIEIITPGGGAFGEA